MRSIIALLLAFVAIVSALAVDKDFDAATQQLEKVAGDDNVQIIPTDLGNDRQKLDIIVDGVYEGYLIETEEGGGKFFLQSLLDSQANKCGSLVQAFDENNQEIEIEDLLDDDEEDDGIEKRNKIKILLKLAKVIKKFGAKAWRFIKCVGYTSTLLNCASKVCPQWYIRLSL